MHMQQGKHAEAPGMHGGQQPGTKGLSASTGPSGEHETLKQPSAHQRVGIGGEALAKRGRAWQPRTECLSGTIRGA